MLVLVAQRGAVPAARAELEFALVDGPTGAALDAQHEAGMFLAELDLFVVHRLRQLVADRRRTDRSHRAGPPQSPKNDLSMHVFKYSLKHFFFYAHFIDFMLFMYRD